MQIHSPVLSSHLERMSIVISAIIMLSGTAVLFAWATDIDSLKRLVPGFPSMNPMTASAFILAGLSLGLQFRSANQSDPGTATIRTRIAMVSAVVVLVFGLLVLCDFYLSWELGLDRILFPGSIANELPDISSRTAPSTGLCFMFAGLTLLFLNVTTQRGIRPAELFALLLMFIALFGMDQYLYGVWPFNDMKAFEYMALHTSVIFGLLVFGILSARPRQGIMALATGNFPGAIILAWGFPLIAVTEIAAGWLRLEGEARGIFSAAGGTALFTPIIIVIFGAVLIWSARVMRDLEANRLHAENDRNRFFDLSLDLLCVASSDEYFTQVNPAFTVALGYTKDDLLSRPFTDFIHPEDLNPTAAALGNLAAGRGVTHFTNRYRCKDGSWRTLSWSASGFPTEGKIYASARDITELMVVKNALHAREEELSITLHSIGDAALRTDVQGRITRLNSMAEHLTGWTQDEALGLPVATVFRTVDEQTRAVAANPIAETLATGKIQQLSNHTLLMSRDGLTRPIAKSCAPIHNREGAIIGAVLTFRDVSEARTAAQQLEVAHQFAQSESRRLKIVLDTVVDGVIGINPMGRIIAFNSAAEHLYGYKAAEVIGRDITILAPQANRPKFGDYISEYRDIGLRKIADTPNEMESEAKGLRKDGSTFPMEFNIVETNFEDEWKLTCVIRDVSERTRYIADLKSARKQADDASSAKSLFLANMSHEIRTPMNGVMGMLDVLHQTSLKGYQVEMVDLIQDSAESLLGIINDILDLSKIEAGRMEVYRAPFDVSSTVENVCVMMDRLADKLQIDLTVFVDPATPATLLGDAQHLRQVLINLISNAIKFSSKTPDRKGSVSVRTECTRRDGDEITIEFQVHDNGIGMDLETQANLFAPFEQGQSSIGRRFGGTGLGLAISHNLTQIMGGDIRVESSLNIGSTFIVELTFSMETQLPANDKESVELAGVSCLVIGQPHGMAPNLAAHLLHNGATVEQIDSLQLARESMCGQKPGDWVWVIDAEDLHSTEAALETARSLASVWGMRFLAVVIERGKRHNLRQNDAGVFRVDGNALCRRTLVHAVAVAAGRQSLEREALHTFDASPSENTTPISREKALQLGRLILVAEDNETNQKVIAMQLALLGVVADITGNGVEALELWRNGRYPLLLTDLHMPDMDGYELTAAIRAQENESEHIGIVALTANALAGEAEHCLLNGMDGYLSKPARLEDIKDILNKWLPRLVTDTTDAAPGAPLLSPPTSPVHSTGPVVDVSVLRRLVGDDPKMLGDILQDFRHNAASTSKQLHAAWQSGKFSDVGAQAHKLKSSARTIGAMELGNQCQRIETAVRNKQYAALEDLVSLFDQALVAVDQYLESY